MPQSLAHILVHLVFSTKNREPWLALALRPSRTFLTKYGVTYDERYVWD